MPGACWGTGVMGRSLCASRGVEKKVVWFQSHMVPGSLIKKTKNKNKASCNSRTAYYPSVTEEYNKDTIL